ncbi:MAG: CD225/dispanin family protein [Intrasporangium sp.]|uniref:CD225/dispanin family protein n=1 Tax=Intrasporangium sp. TaxID=1925024 RepID=UPI002647CC6E|nr:CD225/dispanin family protein [Intrasporangium sp.]MDN5796396.1 CD225/dispanin family protein [Intrasporangium sp.]
MTDDRWAPAPDPTRDRYSAWADVPAPSQSPLPIGTPPPSYLLFGILTAVFCFLPFGIVSVVKGRSIEPLWAQGRCTEARRASRAARNWAIAAVVCTPIQLAFVMVAFFLGILALAVS